ncbi:MAG: efflux RND transporter permease subunit [Opitutales bacterium]|nr:efflux RND transporter permease subunit [Opitutales bacterium]
MRLIPAFTVERPVFTSMATLVVVLIGAISFWRLPIDLLPEIELPNLTISTSYEDASPEEVEELVTRVIEEAVARVPGVEEMVSNSTEGNSQVTISFVWGTNLDEASNDVRDSLDRVINRLPDEVDRPRLRKFDPSQAPVVILGVGSNLDPLSLRRLLDNQVQNRLERVAGVAAVDTWGGLQPEIRVELDLDRVNALNLSLSEITNRLRDANVVVPAGEIEEGRLKIALRTPGLWQSLDEIENTVIVRRESGTIRLRDIGVVEDTHEEISRIVRINGEPGVRMAIRRQSGTNTVDVARAVLAEAERINQDFGQINLVPIYDSSTFIQRSIDNVSRAILFGGILAAVSLFFFLRNFRSTLVITLAIPISLIGTFTLIYFGGYTLNLMTLGGLALGVGMMVDSAIVVLENIFRWRENGHRRKEAAVGGTSEVAAAIIASTLTTLAIFLPLIYLEGVTGILFRQLAVVIGFALFCSLVVALTLMPMLASRLPKKEEDQADSSLVKALLAVYEKIERQYRKVLEVVLANRMLTLVGAAALMAASVSLVPTLGTEFMPESDEGEVRVNVELAGGTRVEVLEEFMRQVEDIVIPAVPEAENHLVDMGASSWRPTAGATGNIRMYLVPQTQRSRSSEEIAADLRNRLQDIAGARITVRAGGGLFVFRRLGIGGDDGAQLSLEVRGFDLDTLDALAAQAVAAVEDIPGVTDARASREAGVPRQLIDIDRDRAADFGFTVRQVAEALRTAVSGTVATTFRDGTGDETDVRVRLRDADRMEVEDLLDLTIRNGAEEAVALRSMVSFRVEPGPTQIERRDQQRVVAIAINTEGRDMGSVALDVQEALAGIATPPNHDFILRGDFEEQQQAFRELMISLLLSLLLVYMVMACLYESLRDPVIVMFTVPLAMIGAILALFVTGSTLNVNSFIGLIMLGGIVVNNAILIVDQATRLRMIDGKTVDAAIREASRRRLRPILMTTFTTVFALMPLAIGIGEGAEAQAPLARVVVGGLISSAMITLLVIPVVYTLFHREALPSSEKA